MHVIISAPPDAFSLRYTEYVTITATSNDTIASKTPQKHRDGFIKYIIYIAVERSPNTNSLVPILHIFGASFGVA